MAKNKINEKEFTSLTLDELRDRQNKYDFKNRTNITELGKEYSKKMFAIKRTKTPDELLSDVVKKNITQKKKLMDYEKAKLVFWNIYKTEIERRNSTPEVNEKLKDILPNLIKWFVQDSSCKYDLNKGIALFGGVGCGKTMIFDCMKTMCSGLSLDTDFIRHDCVNVVSNTKIDISKIEKYKSSKMLFDDLGAEENVIKSYGNTTSVMGSILERRYRKHEMSGLITHTCTNLDDTELMEVYGQRVYDRMRKMFNFIYVGNKSFRR